MLGHGLAVQAIRERVPDAQVGITLNLYPVAGAHDGHGVDDAVRRIDGLSNRWFLDPVLRGSYPKDVVEDVAHVSDLAFVADGDLETISAPLDFLGVNYYTRHVVAPGAFPGTGLVEFTDRGLPTTAMGWEVDADGLFDILTRVTRDYGDLPLVMTENGAAFDDEVSADGRVHDPRRIDFLASHLSAAARAVQAGVPLRGLLRLVADGQLRVGRGLRQAVRHRPRRLRDPGADRQGQRSLVRRVPRRRPHAILTP